MNPLRHLDQRTAHELGSIFSTNDYIAARFMRNSYKAQKDCQNDGEKNKTTIKNRSQLVG